MLTDKIKEIVKIIAGAGFAIAFVVMINLPVSEELVIQFIDIVFLLIGSLLGGPAMIRAVLSKKLVNK